MKKIALYTVLSLLMASPAFAATSPDGLTSDAECISQPSCADLGYSTTATCNSGSFIYCPFDSSYKKCIPEDGVAEEMNCEALGFTTSDKTSWCKRVVKCPADDAYTLCDAQISCEANEFLIGGKCERYYASCSAAGLMASTECNTNAWTCALPTTIYTSAEADTTVCYRSKMAKACPTGYAISAAFCLSSATGEVCENGFNFLALANPTDYSGDNACGKCSCKLPEIDNGGFTPVTTDCCTLGYKYNVDGNCTNTCPYTDGRYCITCANGKETVVTPTLGGVTSCPGGMKGSACSCGGTHTTLGGIEAHLCAL